MLKEAWMYGKYAHPPPPPNKFTAAAKPVRHLCGLTTRTEIAAKLSRAPQNAHKAFPGPTKYISAGSTLVLNPPFIANVEHMCKYFAIKNALSLEIHRNELQTSQKVCILKQIENQMKL